MADERARVLIVAFDGLRPDMVSAELMPNLTAFAGGGVRFTHSRSAYLTETRVNEATLVTGCYPTRHGIVGNRFIDPQVAPGEVINTGDEAQLAALERNLDGRLVDALVLGEVLAAHGRSLAVISSGTPGGTRMLHHTAERDGGFRLAMGAPEASVPADRVATAIERIGPIPDHEIPSLSWLTYATDIYLEYVEPELAPDVAIVWYCEPDNSYHHIGIGAAANLAAMRHADAEFGRILSWRERAGIGDRLRIVTLSDHGQITVVGAPLGIAQRLAGAGFSVGEMLSDGADTVIAVANAGGIYVRDPALVGAIVVWLRGQPWCGPVFTRNCHGTLTHAQVGIDHRRAPDISFALASDDTVNAHGIAGSCRHDSRYRDGDGLHGGLHPFELSNWLAAGGEGFRSGFDSELPCGIVDVLPTVLDILGVPVPPSVQGRVLREAFSSGAEGPAPTASTETLTAEGIDGIRTHLSVSRVGTTHYIDRGWVERP